MNKLIDSYRNMPTVKNALALVRHSHKHPIAECLLTHEDYLVLEDARQRVREG